MEFTTVLTKFQIVIPAEIRKKMSVNPGNQFWVFYENGTIRLIPKIDIRELQGTLKGIDTTIEQDEEDRI